jgi:HK97 family phage major capsid protein
MSNDTLTAIELLKDGDDRFIFREDMNGEFDGYLLGYPVEVSDNMKEIATKADVIYFGDFSGLALKQRDDALELNVLREKYATQHAVGINAWLEFDAKVENVQKIAKLTMA